MIKTLEQWYEFSERTGKESIYDFLVVGDIVDESIITYFTNILIPKAVSYNYLQIGEIHSYHYDISRRLRPCYMTFSKGNENWRFNGVCFEYETINVAK